MEKRGRYPWGSHWVTGDELDRLQELERENDAKIKDLEKDFDGAEDKVKRIDDDIAETQRGLRRIEATSYTRDASGRPIRLQYPRVYYDMQKDIANLRRDRADQVALMDRLRQQAKSLKQQLPIPRYNGVQRLIEAEGTPLIPMADGADTPAG